MDVPVPRVMEDILKLSSCCHNTPTSSPRHGCPRLAHSRVAEFVQGLCGFRRSFLSISRESLQQGTNIAQDPTETADEIDDFQDTQRSVRRVIEAWIPGGVFQSIHYDRMVDRRCTSAADPGERAATLCGTDRVRHSVADPGADATTHGGADCRRRVPQGVEEIVKVMMFTPQARTGGARLNRLWTHILHKSWRRSLAHPGGKVDGSGQVRHMSRKCPCFTCHFLARQKLR